MQFNCSTQARKVRWDSPKRILEHQEPLEIARPCYSKRRLACSRFWPAPKTDPFIIRVFTNTSSKYFLSWATNMFGETFDACPDSLICLCRDSEQDHRQISASDPFDINQLNPILDLLSWKWGLCPHATKLSVP